MGIDHNCIVYSLENRQEKSFKDIIMIVESPAHEGDVVHLNLLADGGFVFRGVCGAAASQAGAHS
jgi:hypothetical protein